MAGGPGNWCGAIVQLTSANGPVTGNTAGAPLPTVAELGTEFTVIIDPLASVNGVAGKYKIALSGNVLGSLTETGHGVAATSGFLNLGASSAGIWGGYSTASEAQLVGWAGSSQTLAHGSANVLIYQLLATTSAKWRINGTDRIVADGTNSTIASPNGASFITCANTTIEASATTRVALLLSSTDRVVVNATKTSAVSPSGALGFETNNTANAITGPVSVNNLLALTTSIAAPATPSTGFVLYVDVADGILKAKGSSGTVTPLANP